MDGRNLDVTIWHLMNRHVKLLVLWTLGGGTRTGEMLFTKTRVRE